VFKAQQVTSVLMELKALQVLKVFKVFKEQQGLREQ
jgi:hypothetical protein